MKGFHFLQADMTAGSGDEAPWKIGEKRTIADPSKIVLCRYGYHSSPSLWDALPYACGPMASLVEISKPIAVDDEANRRKAVSASRKLIKAVNIKRGLRLFACDCAERVLHIYERDNTSKAPRQAIKVARRFANGKATKKELAAARAAARDAAWDALDAARAAAWAAADAAGAAAWTAARGGGGVVRAWVKWQRQHFDGMFSDIFK